MQLTTRGRYAVTAMLDVALYQKKGAVALSDIAQRQDLSSTYLEQLLAKLRRHGLLTSIRGPGGGYYLKQRADHISVASIIDAVNENIDVTLCKGKKNCRSGARCMTHNLWTGLGEVISSYLQNITLQDLMTNGAVEVINQHQIEQLNKQLSQRSSEQKKEEQDYYG